ncbi:MAG: hypothetical protein KF856_09435 [Cyclobacteriaceae bacterium]|nr:hypothetical protein [Cyclobacteriaceae bacterium]
MLTTTAFGPFFNQPLDSTKWLPFTVEPGETKTLNTELYGDDTGCNYWVIVYHASATPTEFARIRASYTPVATLFSNPASAETPLNLLLTHWNESAKGDLSQCDLTPS